jgi:hypothetical protein
MTWPTVAVNTTNADSGTDNPSSARADLLDLIQKTNQMIAHISAAAAGLLDDASISAMRATLGSTTVGDAVFIATNAAAARSAIGALNIAGDTATGAIAVPAGATGSQVPRRSEVDSAISAAVSGHVTGVSGISPIASSGGTTPSIFLNAIDSDGKINWADTAGLKSGLLMLTRQTTASSTFVSVYTNQELDFDQFPIYIPPSSTTLSYEVLASTSIADGPAIIRLRNSTNNGTSTSHQTTTLAWSTTQTVNIADRSGWTNFYIDYAGSNTRSATIQAVRWRISA